MCTTEDLSLRIYVLYTYIVYNLHAHTHERVKRNTKDIIIYCIIIYYLYVPVPTYTIERLETLISSRFSRTGVVAMYKDRPSSDDDNTFNILYLRSRRTAAKH